MNSFAASAPSRFLTLGAWPARLLLLCLLLLGVQGISGITIPAAAPIAANAAEAGHPDILLYERIVGGVRAGGDYYEVAAREHRAADQPLRPFVTVRLPTLAWMQATMPPLGPATLLYLLLAATLGAWAWQLNIGGLPFQRALLGAMLLLTGTATLLLPELIVWHECWAALLIALSLALWGERKCKVAALLALVAALIREQAILYPLVMLVLACANRRSGEAAAWLAAIVAFAAALAWHAGAVAAVTHPLDLRSPGWAAALGWPAVVEMVRMTGPLGLFPNWAAALVLPIALTGWAGWQSPIGVRGAVFLGAHLLLLGVAARPDNFYWAYLISPLIPIGLLFAPRALADLVRASFGLPRNRPEPATLST